MYQESVLLSIPTRFRVPWGERWVYFALHCIFNSESSAWLRVSLQNTSVACMNEYCQLCWKRWSAWSSKDFLKVSLICFLKSRIRHRLTRMFHNTDGMDMLLQKPKILLMKFVNITPEGSLDVKMISPMSLGLCQYLLGLYQSPDCLLYNHMAQ